MCAYHAAYPAARGLHYQIHSHATDPYSLTTVYTINVAFVPYEELAKMDPCKFVMF